MSTNKGKARDLNRVAQVRKVEALVAIGIPVKRACKDEGLPRSVYYAIKERERKEAA